MKMIDSLDLQIIDEFYRLKKDEEKKFSGICRSILKCKIGNKEYNKIYRRILCLEKQGVFKIGRNSKEHFILDSDKVFKQRFSFPTKRSTGLAILINKKYTVFEL